MSELQSANSGKEYNQILQLSKFAISNLVISLKPENRDKAGRFVKGNVYRVRKNKAGALYLPDGNTVCGKCWNHLFVVRGKG